ncbi:TPA: hypothetical protein ACG64Z_004367, partial [Escherichia coli]
FQFVQPVSYLDFLAIKKQKYINKSNQQWATGLPTFAKKRPTFAKKRPTFAKKRPTFATV